MKAVAAHTTRSEGETAAVARALAADLRAGAVLLLSGDLGAGKTAFVRGLAEGLGINPAEVSSEDKVPKFTTGVVRNGGWAACGLVQLPKFGRL